MLRSDSGPAPAVAGTVRSAGRSAVSAGQGGLRGGLRVGRALGRQVTVRQLSLARAGAGVAMITRPTLLPSLLGVDSASARTMSWTTRMLGAREIALGLGTWTALRRPDAAAARLWLWAGVLSDGVDALAVGSAAARGQVRRVTGAGLTVVAGGAVAAQLSELDHLR